MSFQLAYIELQVPHDVYEIAEKQLDRKTLTSYYKAENNLWTGTIDLGVKYEVEAMIRGGQVLNTSCDCKEYSKEAPCSHITMLLIQLRRDLSQSVVAPSKPKEKKQAKVKISKLLENTSKEELGIFVQQYARKNKGFANELKAFLSSSMADMIESSYYSQLILSAMRINRKKDNSISIKGAAHIRTIIEELWLQSQDKIAAKKYTEATAILRALALQLPIIIDKVADKGYFTKLFADAIGAFNSFPQNLISPELSDESFEFLNTELNINIILGNNLGKMYFHTLLEMATTQDKKDLLKQTIKNAKRQASKWSKKNYISLILIEIKLSNKEGDTKQSEELINRHLTHPDILFHVIQEAEKEKNWDQVRKFAEIGLGQKFNQSLNKVLYQYLYQDALQSKNNKQIQKYAEVLFLYTYEMQYLSKLLDKVRESERDKVLKALLKKIENTPFHTLKKDAIGEIFLQLADENSLFAYIEKIKSLELLETVSERLIPSHKKRVTELYICLIKDYLDFHLGPIPIQKVRKVLLNLRKIGAHDMVHKITDKIALEFSERSALLVELEIL